MYKPLINSILVEIVVDEWAPGNDDSMLGRDYREGRVVEVGPLLETRDYPHLPEMVDIYVKGVEITWNYGVEAGTTFEEDGKLYGFIYWWDIRGVKL